MSLSRRPYPSVEPGLAPRQQLRKELLRWRESMPSEQNIALANRIGQQLARAVSSVLLSVFESTKRTAKDLCIGVYWPIRGEPDLRGYYAALTDTGYSLALPFLKTDPINGKSNIILSYANWAVGDPTMPGKYGIEQPELLIEVIPDLILAPCVGFDAHGYRLGYGAGYFDRTLSQRPTQTIGIAFAQTQVDDLHPSSSDVKLNAILTEFGTHFFAD